MMISFEGLAELRGKVALVDGGFDPFHAGHLAYFKAAAALGFPLLCRIAPDDYILTKHPVMLPQAARGQIIDALEMIDYVLVSDHTVIEVLDEVRPIRFIKGKDWNGTLPTDLQAACDRFEVEVAYTDSPLDSSSNLIQDLLGKSLNRQLSSFEARLHEQTTPSAEDYHDAYFADAWRADGHTYDLETRRKVEGRNPELNKQVFSPVRTLDLGCGPGSLMMLLTELGLEVEGVDFSPAAQRLAPDAIKEKIHIGSVVCPDLPSNCYDLVICREVFEHLSILDVQKTVEAACLLTSRFIYATARFHPTPTSLFDFTEERDVDPTHINLMNQDLLRLMFTLQGMKRRSDMEAEMDWLNKGRVLVYEKTDRSP